MAQRDDIKSMPDSVNVESARAEAEVIVEQVRRLAQSVTSHRIKGVVEMLQPYGLPVEERS